MKDYKKILEGVVNIINITEKSDIGFANICTYIGDNCPELAESEVKWSEEDSITIDNCCLLIGAADDSYEKAFKDDCIHYLQNLKQRMEQ